MKFKLLNRWKRLTLVGALLLLLFNGALFFILYQKQDELIQGEIEALNQTHEGLIVVGDTHIAPFKNFPYISVKVDSIRIFESKAPDAALILEVADIYAGFKVWDILAAKYDVQKLLIEDGIFNVIKHQDGRLNIENALANPGETTGGKEPLDFHLKDIELRNLDIHQFDEGNKLDVETYIYWAKSGFKAAKHELDVHIDTEFELNIIQDQDTSFLNHKHFEFHSDILYNKGSGLLEIDPSGIKIENGDFEFTGIIDTKNDMHLDLQVYGTKPNFDMLIAFAPEALIPTLDRYKNAGEIYFNADVIGPTANGQMPFFDVVFGADEAFLENVDVRKRIDDLGFRGHFTNGQEKTMESMEFSIKDFSSKLDQGNFIASLLVKNFIEPEIELELKTEFNLTFLTQFFNLSQIGDVSGQVQLDMRFHDIIDLEHPEKTLEALNQAYYSELNIENLKVESSNLIVPIDQLDLHFAMTGQRGVLDEFELKMGATDLSLKGTISDLPAILHHANTPVEAELEISSNLLDLSELTGFTRGDSSGVDEQIEDLQLLLKATSSGRAITESTYLPEGVFRIESLQARLKNFPHELRDFHVDVMIDSNRINIEELKGWVDQSDIRLNGHIDNYGALLADTLAKAEQANTLVSAELAINSNLLDVAALTGFTQGDSSGLDEQIEDLRLKLKFNSTAQGLMAYDYLPKGEFFIEDFHAQLKHYPHELHDFHIDLLIDDEDLRIKDFTGFIDQSDFHLNGQVHDYGFWMADTLNGDVKLDLSLTADLLRLEDLFSYQGENYVPEDYRHEEFDGLKLHVNGAMHYKASRLHSIDLDLDQFEAKMQVHPVRFEGFSGRIHYEDQQLVIEEMHGQIGRSVFAVNMHYYLGTDESSKWRDNHLGLQAGYIDFDQLIAFNPPPPRASKVRPSQKATTEDVAVHSTAFNIYILPFTDMTFDLDVDHFIYHSLDLQDIHARLRMRQDHHIFVDTMRLHTAGGEFLMSGYFNGSDPDRIYFKPKLKVINADVDQLLLKYENFGQDEVLSDYVHGQISANITGNIRVYPDMVPDIDQSEIHMDVEILNGSLENYKPVLMLSDYMGDKDLSNVQFDTLYNHMDLTNGTLTIPNMTIESTLGHYELSGEQSLVGKLEYYIRIPWKIIKQGARYKLFGGKKTEEGEVGDDEIIEKDPLKNTRYLNLRVKGTLDDYDIQLRKKRERED